MCNNMWNIIIINVKVMTNSNVCSNVLMILLLMCVM